MAFASIRNISTLFQDIYPMLAKSDIIILANEKTPQPCTVVLDGLHFLKSQWILYSVRLKMINCDATTLVMTIRYGRNVTIHNSIFGNWFFDQVQHVSLKNCSSFVIKGVLTLLFFRKASGFLENITIKDLVFTNQFEGLWVQNNSYVKITKSIFVNNTATSGMIKVLDSSTLGMSDCTLQKNNAKVYAGAIYARNSTVHLKQTNFHGNKAVYGGGALYLNNSFLSIKNCIFSNNQVNLRYPIIPEVNYGSGGAILLLNSTFNGINVNFTHNSGNNGGAVFLGFHSKVKMQYVKFSNNTAVSGSAIHILHWSKFLCKNCSLYQNQNVDSKNYTYTAITVVYHSMINVSGFKCENHRGLSCISANINCKVLIFSAIFSINFGRSITLDNGSQLVTVSSSFFNNTQLEHGGAIYSRNSTLDISHSVFDHNRVKEGSLYMVFSTAVLNNCTFKNNSNTAVSLNKNTIASIVKCSFESNLSPLFSGALLVALSSVANVSQTAFLKNSGPTGGAVLLIENSSLVISSCYFSSNTALLSTNKSFTGGGGVGGAIFIEGSTLEIFVSRFYKNYADGEGGSMYSIDESSLFIRSTDFESNKAGIRGGAIAIYNQSFITIDDGSLTNNSVLGYVGSEGGGLIVRENCTVSISNVRLIENKAQHGGAIRIYDCHVTILNSLFMANTDTTIYLTHVFFSHIRDCRFFNNVSPLVSYASPVNVTNTVFDYNFGYDGGVLMAGESSNVSFYNCSFTDNTAFQGGVLFADNSDIHLIASNFTGNNATNGGVFKVSGYIFIAYCIMNNNTAKGDGGVGYLDENSQINVIRSIFRANSAFNDGGVLWIRKSTASVWNSSFLQNWAGHIGGVVYVEYNSVINISQTICFGNKGKYGGVLSARKNTTIFVHNSKILQNSADGCSGFYLNSASVLELSLSEAHRNNANQKIPALCALDNSLFIFKSSLFKGNIGLINLKNSAGYLENCTLIGNQKQNVVTIFLLKSELHLSNTVLEQNIEQDSAGIQSATDPITFINRLHTYKCQIKRGSIILKSNATNFKKFAIKERFLEEYTAGNLVTEETQFASSKFLSSKMSFCTQLTSKTNQSN